MVLDRVFKMICSFGRWSKCEVLD